MGSGVYPKVWGIPAGTSPNVFSPQKESSKQGIWSSIFWGIFPKLLVARWISTFLRMRILQEIWWEFCGIFLDPQLQRGEEKFALGPPPPPQIFMGEKITGTNDYACFSRNFVWTKGGRKFLKKCSLAGAGTKIYFPDKSEVSKRGWRTEGVGARRSFPCHRCRPLFSALFPIPPYEKGDTILGTFCGCILGPASPQPPPANPFSKLLNKGLNNNMSGEFRSFFVRLFVSQKVSCQLHSADVPP